MESRLQQQPRRRLRQLEELLKRACYKRHEYEKGLQISASVPERCHLNQLLKHEVLPEIRKYEKEQTQLLAELADGLIAESEAEPLVDELIQTSNQFQQQQEPLPAEIQHQLQLILEQLQAPGKSASARLKLSLPIIPLLASYELELDTESLLTQSWIKVKSLYQRAVNENP